MTTKYATYAEASEAAQKLGLTSVPEYKRRYRRDPRLPCNPNKSYAVDWVDWYDFLGTERRGQKFYATYAEASEAAQELGLTTRPEYQKGYRQDPRLPSDPFKSYAVDWVDWYDFLATARPREKYTTYAEASGAAQRLGLTSEPEYKTCYRQDPRLPSSPYRNYAEDWVDWYDFLGTERRGQKFYATYAEASEAAQGLGLTSHPEYQKGYRQDPRLPSDPYKSYAVDWVDWYDFLRTEPPGEKYTTYAEASVAAQRLGLTSETEYREGYRQDPRLPSDPWKRYAEDWVDVYEFLGTGRPGDKFYTTYSEASVAAQRLGTTSETEYRKGYRQDPKLPSQPNKTYAEDWVNWPLFLGNESAFDPELLNVYPRFWQAIQDYVEAGINQTSKYSHLRAFLRDYMATQKLIDDPGAMLSKDTPFNERVYEGFVHATGDTVKKARHNICADFLDWVLENYCADEDDDGELIVLPGFRNPLRTVLKGLLDQLPSARRSESNKPALPLDAILRAKEHLIPPGATSFQDLYPLHPFLEDCWFEVDLDLIDEADPNCIYRTVTKDRKKQNGERYFEEAYELWSPVKIVANYVLL